MCIYQRFGLRTIATERIQYKILHVYMYNILVYVKSKCNYNYIVLQNND